MDGEGYFFDGETSEWTQVFLAASARPGVTVTDATHYADETAAMLHQRAEARDSRKALERAEEREAIERAVAKVREIGAFVRTAGSRVGAVYDVETIRGQHVMLRMRNQPESVATVRAIDLVNPTRDDDEEMPSYEPAPAQALRAIVTRLKIADALGVAGDDVALSWTGDPEDDDYQIRDVVIRGQLRPTREGWAKLRDAGLPIMDYDSATIERGDSP